MPSAFDANTIDSNGWRQGAVLGPTLFESASALAPASVAMQASDWLIVASHDCDVVNDSLEKEPVIEVIRAAVVEQKKPDTRIAGGKNPRSLQFVVDDGAKRVVLSCRIHDRWSIPRESLLIESPKLFLPEKSSRLIAEWIAKRYIRAAFPTAFDNRWRSKMKQWTDLLDAHSDWIQGVYIRLNTQAELEADQVYRCQILVAVPHELRKEAAWPTERDAIDRSVCDFWNGFSPAIEFDGAEVLGTDEITLADLDKYKRFDADWLSFADDSPATPLAADMRA